MGVQGEVEVPPQLLDGAATPVLKHVQVDTAAELRGWGGVSVRQRPGLPSPARLTVQGHSPRWPLSHPRVRGCVAWPRGLVCFSGLARVHIQMHTRMYMHTHTHTLPALPTQEGGWSAPPRQGGLRGRTEWRFVLKRLTQFRKLDNRVLAGMWTHGALPVSLVRM